MKDLNAETLIRDCFGLTRDSSGWLYKGSANLETARSLNEVGGVVASFRYINERKPIRGLCVAVVAPLMVIIEGTADENPYAWGISVPADQLEAMTNELNAALNFEVKSVVDDRYVVLRPKGQSKQDVAPANESAAEKMMRQSFGLMRQEIGWQYGGDGSREFAASTTPANTILEYFVSLNIRNPIRGLCVVVGHPNMVIVEAAESAKPYAWVISVEEEELGPLLGGLMDRLNLDVHEVDGCFVMRKKN